MLTKLIVLALLGYQFFMLWSREYSFEKFAAFCLLVIAVKSITGEAELIDIYKLAKKKIRRWMGK